MPPLARPLTPPLSQERVSRIRGAAQQRLAALSRPQARLLHAAPRNMR
jgi:hypothetical protein